MKDENNNIDEIYEDEWDEEYDNYVISKLQEFEQKEREGKTVWLTADEVFGAIRREMHWN